MRASLYNIQTSLEEGIHKLINRTRITTPRSPVSMSIYINIKQ